MPGFSAHSPAIPTVLVDDKRTKVTRWDFAPGAETGWHRHGMDYVVVPVTDGILRVTDSTGTRDVPLTIGGAYARIEGVEHNVANGGTEPLAFVEIEFK